MSYTLFVGENCHQCGEVIGFLESKKILFKKVNVDLSDERPPVQIFAFPALFEGNELLCYGTDIIAYFMQKLKQ